MVMVEAYKRNLATEKNGSRNGCLTAFKISITLLSFVASVAFCNRACARIDIEVNDRRKHATEQSHFGSWQTNSTRLTIRKLSNDM